MNRSGASFQRHDALAARLLGFCVLTVAMLVETGCVSQRVYEQARAEADELTRSLNAVREEVAVLDRHILTLQEANKQEVDAVAEFRAAVQRETELLPVLRQRANEKMILLHAQVTNLANQSRLLARQIAAAKQERASLKVLIAQYKQEVEETRMLAEQPTSPAPTILQNSAEPAGDTISPVTTVPNPVLPPQQMAQVTPVTPVKPPAPAGPVQTPAHTVEESWIDMIVNWLSGIWKWILGLFS